MARAVIDANNYLGLTISTTNVLTASRDGNAGLVTSTIAEPADAAWHTFGMTYTVAGNQLIHYQEALVGEALLALAKRGIKRDSLFRKFPHLDFVLGTNNITDLGAVLDEVLYTKRQVFKTDDRFEENLDYLAAKNG